MEAKRPQIATPEARERRSRRESPLRRWSRRWSRNSRTTPHRGTDRDSGHRPGGGATGGDGCRTCGIRHLPISCPLSEPESEFTRKGPVPAGLSRATRLENIHRLLMNKGMIELEGHHKDRMALLFETFNDCVPVLRFLQGLAVASPGSKLLHREESPARGARAHPRGSSWAWLGTSRCVLPSM